MPERSLHVAVDARCLNTHHLRGAGKSLYELVSRTAAAGAVRWHLLADRPDRSMWAPHHELVNVSISEAPADRLLGWEQWSLPAAARGLGVDILHAPNTKLPWWQPVPTVVTIQNTEQWRQQDGGVDPQFVRDHLMPAAFRRARAVMTVSNTIRRDILARWPALKSKLYLVSPGVHERYLEAEPDWAPIAIGGRVVSEPFMLYVGSPDPQRRLAWALQTWWGCAIDNLSMVVCGLDESAHHEARQLVPRQFQERLFLAPFISEDDMPRLFMRAAAVLYPSLGSGFGLPIIEAQAVGTPVLFSDVGSFSELKGPAAVALPADDLQSWVRAARIVVKSQPASRGPDRIARAWAGQYSWDSHVKRTLAVYEAVHVQDARSHRRHHESHPRAT